MNTEREIKFNKLLNDLKQLLAINNACIVRSASSKSELVVSTTDRQGSIEATFYEEIGEYSFTFERYTINEVTP